MGSTRYRVSGNVLELASGARVEFPHPISDVVEAEGTLVVCLDVMGGLLPRNVFGVSPDGQVLWQIPDVQPNRDRDRYVHVYLLSGSLRAKRWDDLHVSLDPKTGSVLKHEWFKS